MAFFNLGALRASLAKKRRYDVCKLVAYNRSKAQVSFSNQFCAIGIALFKGSTLNLKDLLEQGKFLNYYLLIQSKEEILSVFLIVSTLEQVSGISEVLEDRINAVITDSSDRFMLPGRNGCLVKLNGIST